MKACSLFICTICSINRYTSIKIKPELKKNILKFGYGINYKYEGMLVHSFDRFYVVSKFILPTTDDLKFSALNFDKDWKYLRDRSENQTEDSKLHVSSLITYCRKIGPYVYFYKQQIKFLNKAVHYILKNEIDLFLPKFPTRKEKRGIFTLLNKAS